jgi:hypothetical protein
MFSSDNNTDGTRPESDPESPNAHEDEAADVVVDMAVPPASNHSNRTSSTMPRKLSTFSKMYDIDGDGKLDEAELAMRNMDQSGRGYLTNDKVYKLMEKQLETQRQLFRTKRVMFVLLALVVILALSNLGTSFAAAHLAKDTSTSTNAELVDRKTNEQLSTQSSSSQIDIALTEIDSEGTRRLYGCDKNEEGVLICPDMDNKDRSTAGLTMDKNSCKQMFKQCQRGNAVTLMRSFKEAGQESYIRLCPPKQGTLSRSDRSLLRTADDESVTIEHVAGGHCTISGPAVMSREGEVCQVGLDCMTGYECRKSEGLIATCRRRCAMKRWAPRMVQECQDDCDHATCQAVESEG